MRQETLDDLAGELWNDVFQRLDEIFPVYEMSGHEAGTIATITAQAFRDALGKHFGVGEFAPDRMCESEGPDGTPYISKGHGVPIDLET